MIILIWVDDLVIATSDEETLNAVKTMLNEKFQMKYLGRLRITFDQCDIGVTMSHQS